ncbi:hypothetical protein TcWFU_004300 [Taenia crassiceps]|uniref:Uncharacterized protein n=1 Tax=Taenia crassiceps TaxID=6207 RepID=A0ABR4Q2L2_9CEST
MRRVVRGIVGTCRLYLECSLRATSSFLQVRGGYVLGRVLYIDKKCTCGRCCLDSTSGPVPERFVCVEGLLSWGWSVTGHWVGRGTLGVAGVVLLATADGWWAVARPPIGVMRLVDCSRPLIVKVLRSDGSCQSALLKDYCSEECSALVTWREHGKGRSKLRYCGSMNSWYTM